MDKVGFWFHRQTTPITSVGIVVNNVARTSPESPPFFVGKYSDGKKFVKQITDIPKDLVAEGRVPCADTSLKSAWNVYAAHIRSTMKETHGFAYPGIHLVGGRLEWNDDTNNVILPQFDLAADEQATLTTRLNMPASEEERTEYFHTLKSMSDSLPILWQAQLALAFSHGAVAHFAQALKNKDIAISPFCMRSEQHGFKTPCLDVVAYAFGRGKLYTEQNFGTQFRANAILSVPGPVGIDEKMNEKLVELIKANASGNFEGMRGRADGSGMRIPLPGVFQNATNSDFVGENDDGNGLKARVVVFRSMESKTIPHPEYATWMGILRGEKSGAAGKWLLLRLMDRINQVGIEEFARRIKLRSQQLFPTIGYTKRADTLAACLIFMEMINDEASGLLEPQKVQ